MKYIILLRGVNISGKNKISMTELKEFIEQNNYEKVRTYLNSGNIMLESKKDKDSVKKDVKRVILEHFNLDIPCFILTQQELNEILENIPNWWGTNNKDIYDNMIFIMPPITYQEVLDKIGEPSQNIDKVKNYKNIIFWSFQLQYYQKSNWWKKTATDPIKEHLTIRTANTMKKILEIVLHM